MKKLDELTEKEIEEGLEALEEAFNAMTPEEQQGFIRAVQAVQWIH